MSVYGSNKLMHKKTNKAAAVKVLSIFRINKNLLQKISNNATAVARSI